MQEAAYGTNLRRLQIPVLSPVLASPFCRTRQSAELAFGNANVQVDPSLVWLFLLSGEISDTQKLSILNSFQAAVELPPPQGTNRVIIAHNFPAGVGLGDIPDMGTVVVKPLGQGRGYEVVGRFTMEEVTGI
jgi:hypothetical protein